MPRQKAVKSRVKIVDRTLCGAFNGIAFATCLTMSAEHFAQLQHDSEANILRKHSDDICNTLYVKDERAAERFDISDDFFVREKEEFVAQCKDNIQDIPSVSPLSQKWHNYAILNGISALTMWGIWGMHRRRYPELEPER